MRHFVLHSMMRTLKQRVVIILIATVAGAACGTVAGYLLGRIITLKRAEIRLGESTARTMTEADASSRESRSALTAMNASPYPYCSDAGIAYFHNLLFQSEYLKEAGRIRDGKIDCSVILGRLHQPIALPEPDFSQPDGIKVYKDFALFRMADLTVVGLQLGDSLVIISPYLETHRATPPMHYASTAIYDPNWQASRLIASFPQATKAILTTNGQGRVGDTLYATRCSNRYYNCVTEYISAPDALLVNHTELAGNIVIGGLTGACLGFFLSLFYRHNRSLVQQLRRAIRNDDLRVVYQPIVSLPSRRIVGAEALVRWTNEDAFVVGPDVFVKMAEEGGFVGEITRLVVRHALRDFKKTLQSNPDFQLNINAASADLNDPDLLPLLEYFLEKAAVPARRLAIEIAESCTARHQLAMETILRLHQRGFGIDIDDFGTGYSSLAYLHDLSVDSIKVDKVFTHAIGTEAVTVTVLPQILAMAEALDLAVIVEGIESEQQANYFSTYNQPILGQGWLFGYPVAAEEFLRLLAEDEKKAQTASTGL
jgi:sensor c-di-GMP phosphodiesterase-like protein